MDFVCRQPKLSEHTSWYGKFASTREKLNGIYRLKRRFWGVADTLNSLSKKKRSSTQLHFTRSVVSWCRFKKTETECTKEKFSEKYKMRDAKQLKKAFERGVLDKSGKNKKSDETARKKDTRKQKFTPISRKYQATKSVSPNHPEECEFKLSEKIYFGKSTKKNCNIELDKKMTKTSKSLKKKATKLLCLANRLVKKHVPTTDAFKRDLSMKLLPKQNIKGRKAIVPSPVKFQVKPKVLLFQRIRHFTSSFGLKRLKINL